MANNKPPKGWVKSANNDSVYVATVSIPSKLPGNNNRPTPYLIKVNNTTGAIDLYWPDISGDKVFYTYSPALDKWSVPPENVEFYNKALNNLNVDGIEKLQQTSKTGAVKVIDATSTAEDKDKINNSPGYKSSSGNAETPSPTSPTPASPSSDGGTSTPALTEEQARAIEDADLIGDNARKSFSTNLRYPKNLSKPDSSNANRDAADVVEFVMYSYGKSKFRRDVFGFKPREFGDPIGKVIMAIPPGISDSNSVNWSDEEFSILDTALASASSSIIQGGGAGLEQSLKQAKNLASNENLQKALLTLAAQEAASTKNLLPKITGAIFNPNVELLFKGPLLREFSYVFDLTSRFQQEAGEIKQIIRFFKEGMVVQRSPDYLFLKAPNVFTIRYLLKQGDKDHPYINMVKGPCALTSLNIDYTPQNTYMTTKDGAMISYRMTMTFKELEPLYSDDYINLKDTSIIGY